METVTVGMTLQMADLMRIFDSLPERRVDAMVRQYGEVCALNTAAKILSVTPRTVYAMLEDGRIKRACEGNAVDVRSIAAYIEKPETPREVARRSAPMHYTTRRV